MASSSKVGVQGYLTCVIRLDNFETTNLFVEKDSTLVSSLILLILFRTIFLLSWIFVYSSDLSKLSVAILCPLLLP